MKPRSIDQVCTCCGAQTLLAFAGLKYSFDGWKDKGTANAHTYSEQFELHLCSTCAKNLCRVGLHHIPSDFLLNTLIRFSAKTRKLKDK